MRFVSNMRYSEAGCYKAEFFRSLELKVADAKLEGEGDGG
jgi:hypothetical protein